MSHSLSRSWASSFFSPQFALIKNKPLQQFLLSSYKCQLRDVSSKFLKCNCNALDWFITPCPDDTSGLSNPRSLSVCVFFLPSRTTDRADIMTVSSFLSWNNVRAVFPWMSLVDERPVVTSKKKRTPFDFPSELISVQPADFVYPDYYYDFFLSLLFSVPALSAVFLWLL